MRSIVALGVVSLAVAASMVACGDDSSDDRPSLGGSGGTSNAGTGGTGGTAGATNGGTGGTSAAGTGGTSAAGTGGTGGAGPNTDPLATCTGCVELITPLTGPNDNGGTTNLADQVGYQFTAPTGTVIDMSDAVITWSIAAVAPNANTSVTLYAQNGMPQGYAGAYQFIALDPTAFTANVFTDVSIDLSALAAAAGDGGVPPVEEPDAGGDGGAAGPAPTIVGDFDKSQIAQFGITLGVSAAFTGSTVLRVAVDEVRVEGVSGQADRTFTAGVEGLAINQYQVPPGTQEPVHHP